MNDMAGSRAPAWVRIVAALGLIWNLIGVYFYLVSVGVVGAGAGADTTMADGMPAWVTATFAICVFGGALGSLGLLLLKSWSRLLLVLSLVAVIAQDVWMFALSGATMSGSALGLPVTILLIAIFLAWVSNEATKKGWLS